jgi:hypothetical protein
VVAVHALPGFDKARALGLAALASSEVVKVRSIAPFVSQCPEIGPVCRHW